MSNILMLGALLVGAHILTRGTGGATAEDQLFGGGGGGGGGLFGPGGLFGNDGELPVKGGSTNGGFNLQDIFSGLNEAIERFAGELEPDVTSDITSDENIGVAPVVLAPPLPTPPVVIPPLPPVPVPAVEAPALLDFWTSPVVVEAEKTSGRQVVRLESTTIEDEEEFSLFGRPGAVITQDSNIFVVSKKTKDLQYGGFSTKPEVLAATLAGYDNIIEYRNAQDN